VQTKTVAFGGEGGKAFSDPERDGTYQLSKINIQAEDYIHVMQIVLKRGNIEITNPRRGQTGGYAYTYVPSGPITKVKLNYDPNYVVNYIEFHESNGQVKSYGKNKTDSKYKITTININGEIVGIYGRDGAMIDKLGFLVNEPFVFEQVKTEAEYRATR